MGSSTTWRIDFNGLSTWHGERKENAICFMAMLKSYLIQVNRKFEDKFITKHNKILEREKLRYLWSSGRKLRFLCNSKAWGFQKYFSRNPITQGFTLYRSIIDKTYISKNFFGFSPITHSSFSCLICSLKLDSEICQTRYSAEEIFSFLFAIKFCWFTLRTWQNSINFW